MLTFEVTSSFEFRAGGPVAAGSDLAVVVGVSPVNPQYVSWVGCDTVGRVTQQVLGGAGFVAQMQRDWFYSPSDGDNLLDAATVSHNSTTPAGVLQADTFGYDSTGSLTRVDRDPAGSGFDETECFAYDQRLRLIGGFAKAWTGDSAGCEHGVLVTVDAQQHTRYGTNPCITNTIDRYLIDLIIPPNNLTCP